MGASVPPSPALQAALIGKRFDPFTVHVTAERIGAYAAAIGDANPLRHDPAAAHAAGFGSVVAPPTFGFTLTLLAGQSDLALAELGVTVNDTLHGEQGFEYGAPICGGDVLTGSQTVADVYTRKGGTLLFLLTRFTLDNQYGEHVLQMTQTSIVPLSGGGA